MAIALPQLRGSELITHSRRTCRMSCSKKHWYRYELGVVPSRDSTPLRFGGAFHKGVEVYYQHPDRVAADDAAQSAIRSNYADIPAWALGDPEAEAEWLTECETVCALVWSYVRHWASANGSLATLETVATELPFELSILNPETQAASPLFQFAGKIDRIVKMASGATAVLETKTTSDSIEADSDYWKRLRVDTQITGYMVAAQAMGYPAESVVYDVIRKPSIRPKLVKGARETPAEFGERLRQDVASRPDFYFARREIVRMSVDVDEFLQELWDETQILRYHQKNARWPRNTAACIHPYPCPYRELCFNSVNPLESGLPGGFRFSTDLHPELEKP